MAHDHIYIRTHSNITDILHLVFNLTLSLSLFLHSNWMYIRIYSQKIKWEPKKENPKCDLSSFKKKIKNGGNFFFKKIKKNQIYSLIQPFCMTIQCDLIKKMMLSLVLVYIYWDCSSVNSSLGPVDSLLCA